VEIGNGSTAKMFSSFFFVMVLSPSDEIIAAVFELFHRFPLGLATRLVFNYIVSILTSLFH
jgi:hypothetical protein